MALVGSRNNQGCGPIDESGLWPIDGLDQGPINDSDHGLIGELGCRPIVEWGQSTKTLLGDIELLKTISTARPIHESGQELIDELNGPMNWGDQ